MSNQPPDPRYAQGQGQGYGPGQSYGPGYAPGPGPGRQPGYGPAYQPPGAPDPGYGPPSGGRGGGGRRAALIAGIVAVAAVGAGGGYLLGHRGDSPTVQVAATSPGSASPTAAPGGASSSSSSSGSASSGSRSPRPSTSTSGTTPAKRPVTGVTQFDDAASAVTEVKRAGISVTGKAVDAWSWTDTNGRNIMLATKTHDRRSDGVEVSQTLRVYHVAGLGGRPRVLKLLRDSGVVHCGLDYGVDYVPGSARVTDTDGDGYGEVTAGWWSVCRGDVGPKVVKLALITKGTYYILRGEGLLVSDDKVLFEIVPPAWFKPNVPRSKWPAGTYDVAVAQFKRVFR